MTTTVGFSDDDFERAERGLDWLERLENIRARQDREAAIRETAGYVSRLRSAIAVLSGDDSLERIAELYGSETAALVQDIRDGGPSDPWIEHLRPALLAE